MYHQQDPQSMTEPPTEDAIERKMRELAGKLDYQFKDLKHLKDAMYTRKVGSTSKPNYTNSSLATVGDAVLKLIIADSLFHQGKTRGDITEDKKKMESNKKFHLISERLGLCHYAYNDDYFFDDTPDHQQMPGGEHDIYLEAVAGAVFHDLGFEECRKWVERVIIPMIKA